MMELANKKNVKVISLGVAAIFILAYPHLLADRGGAAAVPPLAETEPGLLHRGRVSQ